MPTTPAPEKWSSRLGVIAAVAGSSVGLGNFLRFPGLAAQYGGGAFMLAYVISFLILGLPCGWMEWTLGRAIGQRGLHSAPALFAVLWNKPFAKYLGAIGIVVPVGIFFYYIVIEGWCLGYAWNFLTRQIQAPDAAGAAAWFDGFSGAKMDGAAFTVSAGTALLWVAVSFLVNFTLVYRGLAKGIELACKWGMPTLVILALIVLARVLSLGTPDPSLPHASVDHGLGYMWNPEKTLVEHLDHGRWREERPLVGEAMVAEAKAALARDATRRVREVPMLEQLAKPDLWLAAAGQIFFSLGVGFGILIVYASYLSQKDDVVLSNLTSSSANEFCEVVLGGLITLPAGVAFLGLAGVAGQGTFGLGFNVLPLVFQRMPLGWVFGALFFFMLFLAALTSSIAMLQPGIAFLEEALGASRRVSTAILSMLCALGTGFVLWFSGGGLKALDTLDFWIGTFLIFVLASLQTFLFCWAWGFDLAWEAMHEGAAMRLPQAFRPVFKWLAPAFLLTIFAFWLLINVCGISFSGDPPEPSSYVKDLFMKPERVAWLSLGVAGLFAVFLCVCLALAPAYRALMTPTNRKEEP